MDDGVGRLLEFPALKKEGFLCNLEGAPEP